MTECGEWGPGVLGAGARIVGRLGQAGFFVWSRHGSLSPPLEDQRKKRLGLKEHQLIAKYSAITRIGSHLQLRIHSCIMAQLRKKTDFVRSLICCQKDYDEYGTQVQLNDTLLVQRVTKKGCLQDARRPFSMQLHQ